MERVLKELIKLADDLDKGEHWVIADKIDELVKLVAEEPITEKVAKKKDEDEDDGQPVLRMRVIKDKDDDGIYNIEILAPAGVSPYDPVIKSYVKKYGPFDGEFMLDHLESLVDSLPHKPNKFRYCLRGNHSGGYGMPAAGNILAQSTVDALAKVANELDAIGAFDLSDRIDTLLKAGLERKQ